MPNPLQMSILLTGRDNASGLFMSFGQNLRNVNSTLGLVASSLAGVGIAAVGMGISSVKAAGDFQQSMLRVQALAGVSKQDAEQATEAILQMATEVGQSPKTMADGLYYIASAGFNAKDSMELLRLSAMSAATGMTDTETVANALTATMKAFNIPATQAEQIMDQMTKTVSTGKTEWADYAGVVGKLSLNAQQAGATFLEANAAFATLTNVMPSSKQAADSLNALLQTSSRFDLLSMRAEKLGISFDANQYKSMNFIQRLEYLNQITGGNSEQMTKLLGRSNAVAASTALLTNNSNDYATALKNISNSAGATDKAFKTTQEGFNQQSAQLEASLETLKIKIGNALLPELTKLVENVTPIITRFADWIEKSHVIENAIGGVRTAIEGTSGFIGGISNVVQNAVNWFNTWRPVIQNTAIALGVYFAPALIQAGIQATVAGVKIAANFVASLVTTGVAAVVNGAKVTASFVASMFMAGGTAWVQGGRIVSSFVASMVTAGTSAVVNAAKITASFVASMISTGVQATISAGRVVGSFVASLIATGIRATITGGIMLASLIPALISFTANALIAAATAIPAILAGFGAWVVGAGAVAIANIAAFWPIYAVIAAIIIIIGLVVLAVQNWGAISKWLQEQWDAIGKWFSSFWADVQRNFELAINNIGQFLQRSGKFLYDVFVKPFVDAWGRISGIFGSIGAGISALMRGDIPGALHHFHVPGFAGGVENFEGGLALVGERGPELVTLPPGSSVTPMRSGNIRAGGMTTQHTINITVNVPNRNRNEAQEIARVVLDELSRQLRRSGSLVTITSGGRA